jgi:hypothetical protein
LEKGHGYLEGRGQDRFGLILADREGRPALTGRPFSIP